jgi:hypothetical protein
LPSSGRCFQVSEELTPPYETPDAAYFFIFVHNLGRGEVNWILTWVLPAIWFGHSQKPRNPMYSWLLIIAMLFSVPTTPGLSGSNRLLGKYELLLKSLQIIIYIKQQYKCKTNLDFSNNTLRKLGPKMHATYSSDNK